MPSIISRVYADKKTAEAAKAALMKAGFDSSAVDVLSGKADAGAEAVAANRLGAAAIAAAKAAIAAGHAVLLVRAGFGSGGRATRIVDGFNPVATPAIGRDPYMLEDSRNRVSQSILLSHYRYATPIRDVQNHRRISSLFGWPTLTSKTTSNSAYSGTVRFGGPVSLLTGKKTSNSAYSGTVRFGGPVPLLSRR
jgi:hypothetical protein